MSKGRLITPEVEALIAKVYLKHPGWTASRIRDEVSFILRERDPNLPYKWPGLSIVQKKLATIHKKAKVLANKSEDKYWSLISLPDYPMHPEAIPCVLKVWAMALERDDPITIREALWVARLYPIFKPRLTDLEKADDAESIEELWYCARSRAVGERLYALKGKYPETKKGLLLDWLEDRDMYATLIGKDNSHLKVSSVLLDMYESSKQR